MMLNIDHLSDSPSYRDEMQKQLADAGVIGVDFSDCQVPQGHYLEQDRDFFGSLEDKVHAWLKEGGWSQDDLDHLQALRQQFQPASWREPIEKSNAVDLAEQSARARTLARRFETQAAESSREGAAKVAKAETRTTEAEARASQLQTELNAVHAANHHHWQLAEARAQQIEAIYQTYSWRITAPLRRVCSAMRGAMPNSFKPRIKVLLQHAALYIRRRPRLKNAVLRGLYRFPGLKSRLFRVVSGINTSPVPRENVPTDIAHLSPRARQIHTDLKAAIERRQKENS